MSLTPIETEIAVIGCILSNYKKCLPIVQRLLKPDDFYDPKIGKVYGIILDMEKQNKAIDIITLSDEVRERPLELTASEISLWPEAGFIPNLETYCECVKTASKRRKLLLCVTETKQLIADGGEYEELVDKLTGKISELELDKTSDFIQTKDVMNDIYNEVKDGRQQGVLTGFDTIDKFTKGFHKNNLIVLAADTGKGKTALALNIIANILSNGHCVVLFTLEMSASENLKRLLAIISETNSNKSNDEILDRDPEAINKRLNALGLISGYDFRINDKMQSMRTIRASSKVLTNDLCRQGGKIDFIVVDYLQIMEINSKKDNREGEVADIARGLKELAKEIDIPILALSQVNRDADKNKRQHRINDLRESAAIGHAADVVLFLNEIVDKYNKSEGYKLDILKNRHGPTFYLDLEFDRSTTKFREKVKME